MTKVDIFGGIYKNDFPEYCSICRRAYEHRNINMHKINDTRKIKMKQCIFCMEWKEDKEFNREHIILEALWWKRQTMIYV